MSSKTRLIFRADGNSQIGLGHVVRCLALAELLSPDFSCSFAIQEPSPALQNQIKPICEDIIALPKTGTGTELLQEAAFLISQFTGHEIIVLDGYQFPTKYQQILKQKGSVLVCLDDLHDRHFVADAIINFAGGVNPNVYSAAPYTKLCLGPSFALLRKPFREAQKMLVTNSAKASNILICFGGADPENYTLKCVQKLTSLNKDFQLKIITGSAYQHGEELQQLISGHTNSTLHKDLSAEEMAQLMQQCAVAITSASSVAYEYCAINGVLFIEKTADNQNDIYQYLISEGLALPAEKTESVLTSSEFEITAEKLISMQKEIFNGQAESNLQKLFLELNNQAQLIFRKFTTEDAKLLFEWANDPVVRQFSFNSAPIPFETHLKWVQNKLANPNALLILAEIQNQPAAFIRFDLEGNSALISYQIGKDFRGKGLGHRILIQGLIELKKYFPEVTEAIGFVQPENIASVRAFEKAQFENLGIQEEKKAYKFKLLI